MGQALYYSTADAGMWRGHGDGSILYVWLRSITLLPWLPGFPPQAFPTTISSLTSPQSVSLWTTVALDLGLHHNLKLQLLATAPSRRPVFLPGIYMALARIVWFSFHLGCHRSAVSLSALNVSPLTQTTALLWGSNPCFSSPTRKGRSNPTNTPVFLPSSFILSSFAWFYVFFSTGQVLLSTLSWYSACTSVLKVYSWCTHGERCTPCLPTPPPPCSKF